MESFEGRLAVVTGGGSGMGRELVIQLAAAGASVATCDVNAAGLEGTAEAARSSAAGDDVLVTTHVCDVADADAVDAFAADVCDQHGTDHVHLLFNNAGIGGGGSFVSAPRDEWDRTFAVTWGGVYNGARSFLPLLIAADEGHLVNTSSVNGFWASLGPGIPHTAYSTAKFAVKGFSEALLEDLRINAPHVAVSVVMPGHIGTDIMLNSRAILAAGRSEAEQATAVRATLGERGLVSDDMDDAAVIGLLDSFGAMFRDAAPMSAADAATVILDGVRAGEWRILVGDDAHHLDERVRADPGSVYGPDGVSLVGLLADG